MSTPPRKCGPESIYIRPNAVGHEPSAPNKLGVMSTPAVRKCRAENTIQMSNRQRSLDNRTRAVWKHSRSSLARAELD